MERLQREAETAHEMLDRYGKQLNTEMRDHVSMARMLKSYISHHRAELSRAEERLAVGFHVFFVILLLRVYLWIQDHKQKHENVQRVRKQLQSHLDSLPDLSKLPSNSGGLAPLPSVGDLFS